MTDTNITYKINEPITEQEFIALLSETSLGERRPLADKERIAAMLRHTNLLVTAWADDSL